MIVNVNVSFTRPVIIGTWWRLDSLIVNSQKMTMRMMRRMYIDKFDLYKSLKRLFLFRFDIGVVDSRFYSVDCILLRMCFFRRKQKVFQYFNEFLKKILMTLYFTLHCPLPKSNYQVSISDEE